MSRFAHLEFDDKRRAGTAPGGKGSPIRNAPYFQAVADRAYLAGDFEVALRNYSRALEQDAAFFEGWLGQVRMLIELGEYEEALVWADKAMEMFPEHPDLLAAKSLASCRIGALDKAIAYSDNAISKKGAGSYVWLARAEALLARNKSTAEHGLRVAVALAGTTAPIVQMECGRTLIRAGSYLAALDYLRAAAAALPKSALAWLALGRCQTALGLPEAEAALSACLSLRPDWDAAKSALEHLHKRGIFSRMRAAFRRVFGA